MAGEPMAMSAPITTAARDADRKRREPKACAVSSQTKFHFVYYLCNPIFSKLPCLGFWTFEKQGVSEYHP